MTNDEGELQNKIRSWLSPPDPWKNHNIACASRDSGSGAWFVQSDTLSEWMSFGPSALLRVHGKRQLTSSPYPFAEADSFPIS